MKNQLPRIENTTTDSILETYFLNNSGHRWIVGFRKNNRFVREKAMVRETADSPAKPRAIDFFEAIGNFAVAWVRIRGKRVQLMESCEEGICLVNNEVNRAARFAR